MFLRTMTWHVAGIRVSGRCFQSNKQAESTLSREATSDPDWYLIDAKEWRCEKFKMTMTARIGTCCGQSNDLHHHFCTWLFGGFSCVNWEVLSRKDKVS